MKHCPLCGGDISAFLAVAMNSAPTTQPSSPAGKYDQTETWRRLVAQARERIDAKKFPTFTELLEPLAAVVSRAAGSVRPEGIDSIVHIVFDRPISPRGGVLYQAAMADGCAEFSIERLQSMGYLVQNGKVVLVDDMPVGRAHGAILYWGGEKQFKRWHMTKPVMINPSRNGDPFFTDEEMIAFGVTWRDLLVIRDAFLSLFTLFTQGVRGEGQIAAPIAFEVTFV